MSLHFWFDKCFQLCDKHGTQNNFYDRDNLEVEGVCLQITTAKLDFGLV
jgi:hypothetical protein